MGTQQDCMFRIPSVDLFQKIAQRSRIFHGCTTCLRKLAEQRIQAWIDNKSGSDKLLKELLLHSKPQLLQLHPHTQSCCRPGDARRYKSADGSKDGRKRTWQVKHGRLPSSAECIAED